MAGRKGRLYRRENDIFSFRYKTPDGRWKEKYTGTRDREGACEFRERFLRELNDGVLPDEMAKWRLDQAAKWWNEFRQNRISPDTADSERYRLKHFQRIFGNVRLKDIANHHLDEYQNKRLEERVGAHSINKEIRLLSQILQKAKLWRRLKDDYKALATTPSDIGQALTRDQLRALADIAATNVAWEAAFYGSVLAANSGLRGGEIKKLKIKVIDLEKRRLYIARKTTKTDKGARHIELNADACEAMCRLLVRANKLGATEPEHYLMPKHLSRITHGPEKGKRGYDPNMHQKDWDTAWSSLTSAIRCPQCSMVQAPADTCCDEECHADMRGITSDTKGIRFHDLRHTFITHMVEREIPLGVIQTFVGHMNARMIDHYTHIASGVAREAVSILDEEPMLTSSFTSDDASSSADAGRPN